MASAWLAAILHWLISRKARSRAKKGEERRRGEKKFLFRIFRLKMRKIIFIFILFSNFLVIYSKAIFVIYLFSNFQAIYSKNFLLYHFSPLPHCHAFLYYFPCTGFFSLSFIYFCSIYILYIYLFRKFFLYYSSWQCGNGGNGFSESFII